MYNHISLLNKLWYHNLHSVYSPKGKEGVVLCCVCLNKQNIL